MSPQVTKRKLSFLVEYINDLEKYKKVSINNYDKHHYEIERLLQLIIEVACDINAHLIVVKNEKPPNSYYESFLKLGQLKVISKKLAKILAPSSGLRNALIHRYESIDNESVRASINIALRYFPAYVRAIQKYLNKKDI